MAEDRFFRLSDGSQSNAEISQRFGPMRRQCDRVANQNNAFSGATSLIFHNAQ